MITGASGLLGTSIAEQAAKKEYQVYSGYKDHDPRYGTAVPIDLTNEQQVRKIVNEYRPDIIVNAAAVTDVDFCESNPDIASLVNATSVRYLAEAAKESNSFLIQVSTDYVFDGIKGTYLEEDNPNPINQYGLSKLMGEEMAKKVGTGNWAVARASVVYGWGRVHRPNAATYVYEKLSNQEKVSMIKDQYCSPTLNTNLASMILEIGERSITGVIHTSGATRISRYDFAVHVAQAFNLDTSLISAIDAASLNWKAKRPRDSSLNISKASRTLSTQPLLIRGALEIFSREHAGLSVN